MKSERKRWRVRGTEMKVRGRDERWDEDMKSEEEMKMYQVKQVVSHFFSLKGGRVATSKQTNNRHHSDQISRSAREAARLNILQDSLKIMLSFSVSPNRFHTYFHKATVVNHRNSNYFTHHVLFLVFSQVTNHPQRCQILGSSKYNISMLFSKILHVGSNYGRAMPQISCNTQLKNTMHDLVEISKRTKEVVKERHFWPPVTSTKMRMWLSVLAQIFVEMGVCIYGTLRVW